MHELGIVNYVVDKVNSLAMKNGYRKIGSVTLEFGEVSGIVPDYLTKYWNWYTKDRPLFAGSKLKCETISAETWCDSCKQTYPTVQFGKICPRCGSDKTWLLRGNEMMIKEVEVS